MGTGNVLFLMIETLRKEAGEGTSVLSHRWEGPLPGTWCPCALRPPPPHVGPSVAPEGVDWEQWCPIRPGQSM